MKFILTQELGRLVKWLRILGYDSAYFKSNNIGSLVIQALREERIILTRNQRLPKGRGLKIVLIQNEKLKKQITEVVGELKIKPDSRMMFSRCTICNTMLEDIDKAKVKDKVPEYVFNTQDDFMTCSQCQRIYWKGTHWGDVEKTLAEITG